MVVIKVNKTVPTIAGKMPPLVMPSLGKEKRKSQLKAEYPFEKMS
jgi:hypothetical protein